MKNLSRALGFAFACLAVLPLPAQDARLVNISTRGQVGTDADMLVGGFFVSGSKTVLIRAIGPGLAAFGVPGTLPDPVLSIIDGTGAVVASNDNWNAVDAATAAQVAAFPLPAGSKDAVVVAQLSAGPYTAQISGLGTTKTGVAILEIYDVSGGGQLLNIATRLQVGTGLNAAVAGFVVSGSGTRKLLVRGIGPALGGFGLPGSLPDPKLVIFDSNNSPIASAVANGGVSALVSANAQAGAFASTAGDTATIVSLNPGLYTVQLSGNSGNTTGLGLIEVYDITSSTGTPANLAGTPQLYFASLRPTSSATTSTGSGYATILFEPNTNIATVSISQSNLSSAQTGAHLVLGNASSGNFVFNLPRGQAGELTWTFPVQGANSTTAIIDALKSGQLFVTVDSANYPAGELQGGFIQASGSQTFTAPAAPPALPATALTAPTQADAARFLTQATFGPTAAEIAALTSRGIGNWITDQMALPATSLHTLLRADGTDFPNPPQPSSTLTYAVNEYNFGAAWSKLAITAPDQLRQRVAFALSEIFVIGNMGELNDQVEMKAKYWDLLGRHAFGSYRQMLEEITLTPAMGLWLSHLANQKANPVKGTVPDENYAREIQQLFSIGLVQLQPDGSLMLDAAGQPIPTYNQDIIAETAKVFTGWAFAVSDATTAIPELYARNAPYQHETFLPTDNARLIPMRYFDAFHDKTEKRVVSLQQVPLANAAPTIIPAGQTGPQDLAIMLDTLANHPNVGPFLSRQLIQRLVTSNPSAGYVYRVARVFANDGTGTRGNLGAVVRAILTDYEARSPDVLNNVGYGKVREPLVRFMAMFRALNISAPTGRFTDGYLGNPRAFGGYYDFTALVTPATKFGQAPLKAESVFNFFAPDYAPPGPVAAAGLVSPEMQIMDSYLSISVPAALMQFITPFQAQPPPPAGPSPYVVVDYSALFPLVGNPGALVDQLNLLFCANQMTASTRETILSGLQALAASVPDIDRIKTALSITLYSPDGGFQK